MWLHDNLATTEESLDCSSLRYKYEYKYLGFKHEYKYKYLDLVLEYNSSTTTSTKYYSSNEKSCVMYRRSKNSTHKCKS